MFLLLTSTKSSSISRPKVGPSFGRKMMTGYVRSKELKLTNNQVMKSLRRVNPVNHARRRDDTVRRRNPVPYYAPYYGNKLHCDQNEKLAMYGCTLFAFSDGCSSKVVKLFSMPKKNAVVIYSHFRLAINCTSYWLTDVQLWFKFTIGSIWYFPLFCFQQNFTFIHQ